MSDYPEDLRELVETFEGIYEERRGEAFPQEPRAQLDAAVRAVFESWDNRRARDYRRLHRIDHDLGTAVNVQQMVFGNKGDNSGTGVCFTRDPSTGERTLYGEFLVNAQGEDVVAGIRTPQQITLEASREWAKENGIPEALRAKEVPSLAEVMPDAAISASVSSIQRASSEIGTQASVPITARPGQ